MRRLSWIAQNDATDADGFLFSGPAAFEHERAALAAMGAPDTDSIHFLAIDAIDRDEALVEAHVSNQLAAWMREELSEALQ